MNLNVFKASVVGVAAFLASVAVAEVQDRPTGIKIGQRMTLRPYVSASVTYDSNVSGRNNGGAGKTDDVLWTINPGLGLDYRAENWSILFTAYYSYRAYSQKRYYDNYNQHSYGETFRWNWSNSQGAEKGWTLMLSETFSQITMADDLSLADGRAYNADRRQMSAQGVVQRRFNENWHSELDVNWYDLDYMNDKSLYSYGSLYGWQRWSANWSAGFAPSQWTDFLVNLGYQGYLQDNVEGTSYSGNSKGYTAQVGLGSYATKRISYRALAGWSRFDYANSNNSADGFVYTLSGNWKISDTWNTMLLASSYYQPSERELTSQSRVDSLSWGLGKSLVRGKLRATLDCTYRHETQEAIGRGGSDDYATDTATARFGLDYTFNRFLALFAYAEYLRSWCDEDDGRYSNGYNDYDRWRVTGGVRFTY